MQTGEGDAAPHLVRRLGFWSAVGIVVGITIGSGIFRTPAVIAARVPNPAWVLALWVLGGIVSLCGALSVAELSAALPLTGGWYVFLREGWGPLTGFLFGWSELVLIRAATAGAIATVFAEYFLRSFGVAATPGLTHAVAAAAILTAGVINIRGVQLGAAVTGASTAAKFGALALLVVLAFWFGRTGATPPAPFFAAASPVHAGAFGLALVSVLWAYDGFADVAFAAGEVRDPQRTLPRAIVGGTCAIITIYLLTNAAYLYVQPIAAVARSPLIAADTMQALVGPAGVTFVAATVAISTFGALMATMLAGPRVFFAIAADGLFFRSVARVHPRHHTPHVAIGIAMALGVAFVLTRTFEQLADTVVLAIWPFYGLAVAAVYRLRRRRPDLPRPYKTPGYPLVPAIFIAGVLYLVVNAVLSAPVPTLVTFGVVLAGVPVYWVLFAQP